MGQSASQEGSSIFVSECNLEKYRSSRVQTDPPSGVIDIFDPLHNSIHSELISISCGIVHSALLTVDGDIFIWGEGNDGQLGLDTEPSSLEIKQSFSNGSESSDELLLVRQSHSFQFNIYNPEVQEGFKYSNVNVPTIIKSLSGKCVKKVSCGGYHTLALLTDGAVYSWGRGRNGQLGHGNELSLFSPHRLAALEPYVVSDISAGKFHSGCVTTNPAGWVFTWGLGLSGRLGLDADFNNKTLPALVVALLPASLIQTPSKLTGMTEECVCRIICGGSHSAILTTHHRAATWGGENGTCWTRSIKWLKLPSTENANTLEAADLTHVIHTDRLQEQTSLFIDVALGIDHGGAVTSDGRVWYWDNTIPPSYYLQNEIIKEDQSYASSEIQLKEVISSVFKKERFIQVYCGDSWTAYNSENMQLYLWGDSYFISRMFQNQPHIDNTGNNNHLLTLKHTDKAIYPCVILSKLSSYGIVGISGGSEHIVALANRKLFISNVLTTLWETECISQTPSFFERLTKKQLEPVFNAWSSSQDTVINTAQKYSTVDDNNCLVLTSPGSCISPLTGILPRSSSLTNSIDSICISSSFIPESQSETNHNNSHGSNEISTRIALFSLLFPTLALHPNLANYVYALYNDIAEQRIVIEKLKELSDNPAKRILTDKLTTSDQLKHLNVKESLAKFASVFLNNTSSVGSPHNSISIPSESEAVLASVSAELKTQQHLVSALLITQIESDSELANALSDCNNLRSALRKSETEVENLRRKIDTIQAEKDTKLNEAGKKFSEKELKWRNTVQHLRSQLDSSRAVAAATMHQPTKTKL